MKDVLILLLSACIPIFVGYIAKAVGSLSTFLRNKYGEVADTQTKKEIVTIAVKAVEQIFKTLHGEEKLAKAKEFVLEMLDEKGIVISEVELDTYIHSVVKEFNDNKPIINAEIEQAEDNEEIQAEISE